MADGGAPPLPQSDVIPTLTVDAGAMVADLMAAIAAMDDGDGVEIFSACAGLPESGVAWTAIVIAEAGAGRWLMSAETARGVAAQLADDRTLAWAFGDRGHLAGLFLTAAGEAEALAAGRTPFTMETKH